MVPESKSSIFKLQTRCGSDNCSATDANLDLFSSGASCSWNMLSFECVVVWLCPPLGAELRLQESFLSKPEVKLESFFLVHFLVLFLLRLVPQIMLCFGFFFFFFSLLCFFFSTLLIRSTKLKIPLGAFSFLMKLCCLVSLFFYYYYYFSPSDLCFSSNHMLE